MHCVFLISTWAKLNNDVFTKLTPITGATGLNNCGKCHIKPRTTSLNSPQQRSPAAASCFWHCWRYVRSPSHSVLESKGMLARGIRKVKVLSLGPMRSFHLMLVFNAPYDAKPGHPFSRFWLSRDYMGFWAMANAKGKVHHSKLRSTLDLDTLPTEWDSDATLRERMRSGGTILHPSSGGGEDIPTCVHNKELLLPLLTRMATSEKKVHAINSWSSHRSWGVAHFEQKGPKTRGFRWEHGIILEDQVSSGIHQDESQAPRGQSSGLAWFSVRYTKVW